MSHAMREESGFLAELEAFAAEQVAPFTARWDRERRAGLEAMREAGRRNLIGIQVPVALGGRGLGFAAKARAAERLAGIDFGFAMALLNTHNAAAKIAEWGRPELVDACLSDLLTGRRTACTAITEPQAGSDISALTTTARKTGAGWRIDGTKAWLVNGGHAGIAIVYAQTDYESGLKGLAAFVVDCKGDGVSRTGGYDMAGQHGIAADGLCLDGYAAAPEALLVPPGEAFPSLMAELNGARAYVAAMCIGMVENALETARAYGARRNSFGRPLQAHQGWRWRLAEAAVELEAARSLTDKVIAVVDAGEDAELIAAKAKLFASRMAERQMAALIQAMGAEGLSAEHPLCRHLVAARITGIVDGTSEMLLERVAKGLRSS